MEKVIKKVLEKLAEQGFESYIVGGYVRDNLLGISSFDVDICTPALPKDIHRIFNITPNKYGGSNLIINKYNIDITTFRKEENYQNRRPQTVNYITDLEMDLQRRDFTINAICMDKDGNIIDKLNGVEDLNNRLIKMIGNPDERLQEDPLRILRTIRFATTLNFQIDEHLKKSLAKHVSLVKNLSKTRIKEEFVKILSSPNFQIGLDLCQGLGITNYLGIRYEEVVFSDIIGMWSQITIDGITFTKEEMTSIKKIQNILSNGILNEKVLYTNGLYICSVAASILNYNLKDLNMMYNKMAIKERKDIAINSDEIMRILNIKPSKVINNIYIDLENNILNQKLNNNITDITNYIIQNKGKWLK